MVQFTWRGLAAGALACVPFLFGALGFGLAFGLAASQAGLGIPETVAMSALVFAGASQFTAVALWQDPIPALAVVSAVALVNARHLIMGATLAPWLGGLRRRASWASLFFLVDETWALSLTRFKRAEIDDATIDAAFLLGGGLLMWLGWVSASFAGRTFGDLLVDPTRFGLDFVGLALFLALMALFWTGRAMLLPWLAAAAAGLVAYQHLPLGWHALLGALAGAITAALLGRKPENA